VEFANQRQNAGIDKRIAIVEASIQRLRPILMTSSSTILGLIPLALASGEGANGRVAMGTAVIGGLLISTFLTLFLIPAMYIYLSTDRKSNQKMSNGDNLLENNEVSKLNIQD
jgi:multidrug efflux pump